ncbi:ABC transporter permease [Bifidobacterium sp. 82T10]|uniref:ABC transporter permease n=1 Tax=Bifidobacterium miconis TaxID=2834435 RepID=A0ABS6WHR1_9BIFI|nr:ABC transporter permease [Bifidobacterium miconis]MBW3093583.1 ABC transporter permease [Bifidobacterium miconis]
MKNREKKSMIAAAAALLATPAMLLACATPAAFATAEAPDGVAATTAAADGANESADGATTKSATGATGATKSAVATGTDGTVSNAVADGKTANGTTTNPAVDGGSSDGTVNGGNGSAGTGGDGTANGGTSGNDTTPVAGPVPNIIITNFDYGSAKTVPVGSDFNLSFTFQNMGKVAIDNLVVTVDGGESFAIAGGTNTFYFDRLGAGYAMTQSLPMQVLPSATSGAQGVTVSFKYEYVDAGTRSSNNSDIKISVPVSQPDRFELTNPVPPDGATVGSETTVTLNYVNKGKGDIANVEASIEGEGIQATNATQYVGNVASGANGSIGFAFTPTQAGDINATLRVTYEDSDGKTQKKEFPITISATDAAPVDPNDNGMVVPDDTTQEQGVPMWAWIVGALAVAVALVAAIVIVRKKRKAKANQASIDDEWDDWSADGDSAAAGGDAGTAGANAASGTNDATQVIAPAVSGQSGAGARA